MEIQGRYTWEAERPDGTIITEGGDLTGCVRFSLRPADDLKLPGHDLVGVEMTRRFARGFQKIKFADCDEIPCCPAWENGSAILATPMDLREYFLPGDVIRQRGPAEVCEWYEVLLVNEKDLLIDRPFGGKSSDCCPSLRYTPTALFEYVHCVVCKGFRFYVRSTDGAALITPEDFELYL